MNFRRHPEYKDSGIEWLGEVPADWEVKRLRYVAQLNPSKSEVTHLPNDTEVSFVPMEAVGDDGSIDAERTRSIAEVETGYTYFRDGDVTIAKITPCFENGKGAVMRGLVGGIGFGTTELIVVRPVASETTSAWLHWLFTSRPFRMLGEATMYGAGGQKRVPDEFVRNFATVFPPLPEQAAIAAFLDRETAKIDALIAEQERLIELLMEKRQAVISHAVTKGLDPDVPMKDSGVEWLGEVPAHWTHGALRHIADRIVVGIAEAATHAYVDDGVPILRSTNIRSGRIVGDVLRIASEFAAERDSKLIRKDDLVTVRTGAAGATAVIPEELDGCQCFTMLITTLSESSNSRFYCYFMNGAAAQDYFALEGWGTAQVNISVPILKALQVPIPPESEQRAIADYLDRNVAEIEALVTEVEKGLTILDERRSVLISAAVTGRFDVRASQLCSRSILSTRERTSLSE